MKSLRTSISRIGLITIAMVAGLFILAGYLFQVPLLKQISGFLLGLAVILSGIAVFIGIINLLNVHVKKISRKQKGAGYSGLLVIALGVTFLLGLAAHYVQPAATAFSDTLKYIQIPVEASLMGVLAITLTYASIRLLRRRLNLFSIIFLVTVLLVLLGTASLPFVGEVPGLSGLIRPVLDQVFATAGARGILLGVALGTLTTGLRVLFGADRPYGAK